MNAHKIEISAAAWAMLFLLPSILHADALSFQYDALDRLVKTSYGDGRTVTYTYDAVGNRTSKVVTDADTDHDGILDSIDPDDDNDGVPDAQDAFPLDSSEQIDTDRDAIGNNADPDDDNDGRPDSADNCPLRENRDQADADHDGIGNACDPDDLCTECLPSRGGWRAILRP